MCNRDSSCLNMCSGTAMVHVMKEYGDTFVNSAMRPLDRL